MTEDLRKSLIKIAHSHNVKCRFSSRVKIPYSDVRARKISLCDDPYMPKNIVVSDFFHELGHIVDFENGFYKAYYKEFPTKKDLRLYALKAELHTDFTGSKLMKKYFPKMKFNFTYKYKIWQKFLKKYWGIK